MFISIRVCETVDLPSLHALYCQLHEGDTTTSPADIEKAFHAMHDHPGCMIMVVEASNTIVGTFVIYILPNMTHGGRPAAIIENIVVDDQNRGRGIGRAMLEFAYNFAVANGCYKLSLTSNASRDGAHEFYRRCGMTQHGLSFRYTL